MFEQSKSFVRKSTPALIALAVVAAGAYALYSHPPVQAVRKGELGVRINRFTAGVEEMGEGAALVLPVVHELRTYPLRDQTYRPTEAARADGPAPLQSL